MVITAPAPAPAATAVVPAARCSPFLDVVLREIEHSGSGSAHFWRVFGAALPHLSDAEVERAALATGGRGRRYFRAITESAASSHP